MMDVPQGLIEKLREMSSGSLSGALVARAPGRVEVLGNHTDYNGGVVLASTIDRYVWSAGIPSDDIRVHSLDYNEEALINTEVIGIPEHIAWSSYLQAVYLALDRRNHPATGVTAVVKGDVPQGGGLSSSAALEVSFTNLVLGLSGIELNPKAAAMLSFEAENLFCGIACGVMDQFTSQLAKPNSLLGINCTSLLTRDIPLDDTVQFLIVNSMVTRAASEALNQRRLECLSALKTLLGAGWDIRNLSDVKPENLASAVSELPDKEADRLRHVVLENARVRQGMALLENRDFTAFGNLMYESHASSRDLYEVSHPKLDRLVDIASRQGGVLGSRLTGAGLGGAVLVMCKASKTPEIAKAIASGYEEDTGMVPDVMPVSIPGGVVVSPL
jgi:galactokinase